MLRCRVSLATQVPQMLGVRTEKLPQHSAPSPALVRPYSPETFVVKLPDFAQLKTLQTLNTPVTFPSWDEMLRNRRLEVADRLVEVRSICFVACLRVSGSGLGSILAATHRASFFLLIFSHVRVLCAITTRLCCTVWRLLQTGLFDIMLHEIAGMLQPETSHPRTCRHPATDEDALNLKAKPLPKRRHGPKH